MIKIPPISNENKQEFEKEVTKMFKSWCKRNKAESDYDKLFSFVFQDKTKNIFNDYNIKRIILGDLSCLKDIANELGDISNGKIINIYRNSFLNNQLSKKWAKMIGVTTCPYCNRNYTTTIDDIGIRPDYDHFLPKSKYPYFCVSMYNLIPCCKSCNWLKKDFDTMDKPFIYPFNDAYEDKITFDVDFSGNITDLIDDSKQLSVNFVFHCDKSFKDKFDNTNNVLQIEKLYKTHNDYARDIVTLSLIYNDAFIDSLQKTFKWLSGYSQDSMLNILFLNQLMMDNWNKRPFSKFTYDIVNRFRK